MVSKIHIHQKKWPLIYVYTNIWQASLIIRKPTKYARTQPISSQYESYIILYVHMLYITIYIRAIATYVHEQYYIYHNSTVIYVNLKRNNFCVHV